MIMYDCTWRHTIKCTEELKISKILIEMCITCVQKPRSAVRIEERLSYFFENKTGLKQDDSLSPVLYNLA
jgi:hypothetical protein